MRVETRTGAAGILLVTLAVAGASTARAATPPPDGTGSSSSAGAAKPATKATPTDAERLESAVEAARDAAEAARAAAEASRKAAEALLAAAHPAGPATAKAAPAAKGKHAPGEFTGQLGANLISVTGNANAISTKLSGVLAGTWAKWATELKATAAFGQTRPDTGGGPAQVTALNADLRLRGDRAVGGPVSAYLAAGAATDHVASIELQAYGEAGASVLWLEHKKGKLVTARVRTDLGFRFTRENRFQYFPTGMNLPDQDLYALRIAADLRYALSKTSAFTENLEVLPDLVVPADVRLTSTSILSAQIAEGLALQLAFTVRYIGVPAEGRLSTDTELAAGVTVSF